MEEYGKLKLYEDLFNPFQSTVFLASLSDLESEQFLKYCCSEYKIKFSEEDFSNFIEQAKELLTKFFEIQTMYARQEPEQKYSASYNEGNCDQEIQILNKSYIEQSLETEDGDIDPPTTNPEDNIVQILEEIVGFFVKKMDTLLMEQVNPLVVVKWLMLQRLFIMNSGIFDKSTLDKSTYVRELIIKHYENEIYNNMCDEQNSLLQYANRFYLEYLVNDDVLLNYNGQSDLEKKVQSFRIIKELVKYLLRIKEDCISLVYYTSLNTLEYLFPNNKDNSQSTSYFYPQIMSVSTMNDPEEGHFFQGLLSDDAGGRHRYFWNSILPEIETRYYCVEPFVFCKSFTDESRLDDLSMWEIYGDRAAGCCCHVVIRTKDSTIDRESESTYSRNKYKYNRKNLYNIAYLSKTNSSKSNSKYEVVQIGANKEIALQFDLINTCLQLLHKYNYQISKMSDHNTDLIYEYRKHIMEIAFLFKDASYSHENEIRYLDTIRPEDEDDIGRIKTVGGSEENRILPYLSIKSRVSFEFKEIILGPKVKNPDVAAAFFKYQFARVTRNTASPHITKSAIHYR